MNVLNWIQQERKIADYHVIKWPTSHFHHPGHRSDILGQVRMKPMEAVPSEPGTQATQADGIGFSLADDMRGRYKAGGLGTDGMAADGSKDAVDSKVISTSYKTNGNRTAGPEASTAIVQDILPAEVYSVVESARQSALKVQSRIRQSAAKLKDIYQKPSGQTANTNTQKMKKEPRRQPDKERRGTRHITKDEVLSMQAENHYLLDSYNKNGQYSTLGK